jgi:O-antigen/teichoic acid export membrane protein
MKNWTRRAMSVGASQALELVLQMLLPMALVRLLSPHDFGIYRLVWLVVLTISSLISFAWVDSLFYFLPRSPADEKLRYVRQTEFVLAASSLLVVLAYVALGDRLSAGLAGAADLGIWLVVMTMCWIWGQVLDQLPVVDERIKWQVVLSIALSLARAIGSVLAAWWTRDVRNVVIALALLSMFKVALLQFYVWRFHRPAAGPLLRWQRVREQGAQAIPMGTGGLLFHLRVRVEQWFAAALFAPAQYAAFSVAAVVAPLVMVARKSVSFVLLPRMSREHSRGRIEEVLAINNRVNVTIAALVFPVLSYVVFFTQPLITLVYTRAMIDAVPVMRILVLTWAMQTVDLNSLTLLLSQGRFTSKVNTALLLVSAPLSWFGAHQWGLPGVVVGSTMAIYLERFLLIRRLSKELHIRPVHLQRWGLLLGIVASALACGALARLAVQLMNLQRPAAMLLAGALIGAACYAPVLLVLHRRKLLFASEGDSEGPAQAASPHESMAEFPHDSL